MSEAIECLKWYVDNDDTNEGDPSNGFWLKGKERAQKALKAVNPKAEA
jgi:hypothetical protein